MATQVGIRELKDNLSNLIERAESGEHIVVTRRGKPSVELIACEHPPELRQMIAAGKIRPPVTRDAVHLPNPIKLQGNGPDLSEILSDSRGRF